MVKDPTTEPARLRYIHEHKTCANYKADIGTGFRSLNLKGGQPLVLKSADSHHLLFFLKGDFLLDYAPFARRRFGGGQMAFVPRGADFRGRAETDAEAVDMYFDQLLSRCDKLQLDAYAALCRDMAPDFSPLPIRHPLDTFLRLLTCCLRAGMGCAHLHMLKHQELFLYLRAFYSREELARLFHPIIGRSFDFKQFIYEHAADGDSVEQLASMAAMSRSTFQRKFKETFGEPANTWLRRQMGQRLVDALSAPGATLKEVTDHLGFSSASALNRFCKRFFHCTPTELQERIAHASGPETPME